MILKKLIAGLTAAAAAAGTFSCGSKKSSSEDKLPPPVPAEASDPNTVDFNDGLCDFAEVITDDDLSAKGTLSVEELAGNKMLKFSDDFTVPLDGKVQKVRVYAGSLVGVENLSKVRSVSFDLYADAEAEDYTDENGDKKRVPGTICGGGGTVVAKRDGKGKRSWYGFADFEGGEYNFEYSAPQHETFKFLLADSGMIWDETMPGANFLIMRWGSENLSNLYIDNIVFYDADGKSIPLAGDRQKPPPDEE